MNSVSTSACMKTVNTRAIIAVLLALILSFGPLDASFANNGPRKRVEDAVTVLKELIAIPDGIPLELLARCHGLAIFPNVYKAGFIVGGNYGKGLYVKRNPQTSKWEGPIFLTIGGGSFGWQIGVTASDLVLVVMNPRGVDAIMHENLSLGGDISVAAGPVGRQFKAGTDLTIRSELLAYSRSRGIFAGISLEGTYIHQDYASNEAFYGGAYTLTEIMAGGPPLPPEGKRLLDFLNTRVPAAPASSCPSGAARTGSTDL